MSRDLHAIRGLLARRWAVILPALVLVPLLTLLFALRQHKTYSANAQVLLTYSNIGATLNGLSTNYAVTAPMRNVATQAALARTPGVAREALNLSGLSGSTTDFLNRSSVSSSTGDDLLTFSVTDASPGRTMRLATNYARAYVDYRARVVSQSVASALDGVTRQLSSLNASGQAASATAHFLAHEQQQLVAMRAEGTNDVVLAQPAQTATVVGPHPARSAVLGLGIGVLLAAALVFLMESLDKRATVEEVEGRLRLRHLASIPAASQWQRAGQLVRGRTRQLVAAVSDQSGREKRRSRRDRAGSDGADAVGSSPPVPPLAVLRDPFGREAEAFSVLKSSLEFARLEHEFKTLMLTSARRYRGKAEVAADLAVSLTQAGRRVLLCDLDTQRSSVTSLFGLEERPGVTEVALGQCALEEALVSIPTLSLQVLPFGGLPPHSGFLGTRAVADLVEGLRDVSADLVLIDAPPLLASGEAQTLGALADALVVAVADPVRPADLADLGVTLARLPARPLGLITVGVPHASEGRGRDEADRELRVVAARSNGREQRETGARYPTARGSDPG